MILTCPNCGAPIQAHAKLPVKLKETDAFDLQLNCSKCAAIYRATIACLHEGRPCSWNSKTGEFKFLDVDTSKQSEQAVHGVAPKT